MAEHPYMKLYGRDYLASTRHLTCAARGVYVDLLILSWFDDGVPGDPEVLRRMVGADTKEWRTTWPQLEAKWPVGDDGRRRNPREETERAKAIELASKRSASGKAGATAKQQANAKQTPSKPEASGDANDKLSVAVADPPPTASESEAVGDTPAPVVPFEGGAWPAQSVKPGKAWVSRIGLHVPVFLHLELCDRLRNAGVANPEAELLAWYPTVEDAWKGKRIGDPAIKFWEARFTEREGTTTRKVATMPGPSGVARPGAPAQVVDPDYNGAPYRFPCGHRPTCTTWPQHRALLADKETA